MIFKFHFQFSEVIILQSPVTSFSTKHGGQGCPTCISFNPIGLGPENYQPLQCPQQRYKMKGKKKNHSINRIFLLKCFKDFQMQHFLFVVHNIFFTHFVQFYDFFFRCSKENTKMINLKRNYRKWINFDGV